MNSKFSPTQHLQIYDMVSDLVWTLSLNGCHVMYANSSARVVFAEILASSPGSADVTEVSTWLELVHPEDRTTLVAQISQLSQPAAGSVVSSKNLQPGVGAGEFRAQFRLLSLGPVASVCDGAASPPAGSITLDANFRLFLDEHGAPEFIAVTANDISRRTRIEEKLEESQAIYDSLVDSLPINVFRKDREGKIVFANRRYCDELGRPLEQLLGMTDADLFDGDLAEKYSRDDAWVLQTGQPFHDIEVHPKGDESIYVEVLKAPVTDKSGRRIGIQGLFWDVTDRKQAEDTLRAAKELAESTSRAKSDFLANVSHEIRTPMNGIIGMAELLQTNELGHDEREYVELIQTSAESLLSLINDILDFSKIEAGKVELDTQRFELRESLGDTLRSLALRAHAKGLELICEIDADVPQHLIGDLTRLRQVIVNLISNSVKFTDRGYVCLAISTAREPTVALGHGVGSVDPPADTATQPHTAARSEDQSAASLTQIKLDFRVTDTGIGIPASKHRSIFNEFEQADSSTTRTYGGTGLGLSIASRIVTLMGGELAVASEIGQGSEFYFTAEFDLDSTSRSEPRPTPFDRQRVLVTLREPMMAKRIVRLLEGWNLDVESASTSASTLQLLLNTSAPYELLVTDLQLSDETGMQLASRIRAAPSIAHTRIIFLANTNQVEAGRERGKLNIDDQLLKPVRESELHDSISRCLDVGGATTVPPSKPAVTRAVVTDQLKVLVAEDNLVNQKLIVVLLEKSGHAVTLCADGRAAVAATRQQSFDLILMDIQMPEMDGFEATYEIRKYQADQELCSTPIIALTAHASASDRKRCLAAGMDDYLAKPIHAKDLFELIDRHTGHRSTIKTQQVAPANQEVRVVDWERAFETVGGDRPLLAELIRVYLKDESTMVGNLNNALTAKNEKELWLCAHSFKGALTHLGAREPASLVGQIEEIAAEGNLSIELEHVRQLLDQFRAALAPLADEFQLFIAEP